MRSKWASYILQRYASYPVDSRLAPNEWNAQPVEGLVLVMNFLRRLRQVCNFRDTGASS